MEEAFAATSLLLFGIIAIGAIYSASPAGQAALEGAISSLEDFKEETRETVIEITESAKVEKKENKDNCVYVMRDQNNQVAYVGRTNNPQRRQREHNLDPSKSDLQPLEVVYSGLTRGEARVVEQVLISAYILDNLYNARREIAVSNIGNYRQSLNSAMRLFGSLSEESLYYLMGS